MKALGIALMVAGVVFGLGGLWWWALLGMASEVGLAVFLSASAVFIGGMVAIAYWDLNR